VRDRLRGGMLRADCDDAGVLSFAGFGEGVVAAVEVFALLLQFILNEVFAGGQAAVETEHLLLFLCEGAQIYLVLLVGVHLGGNMNLFATQSDLVAVWVLASVLCLAQVWFEKTIPSMPRLS